MGMDNADNRDWTNTVVLLIMESAPTARILDMESDGDTVKVRVQVERTLHLDQCDVDAFRAAVIADSTMPVLKDAVRRQLA
jgi:hypothetical protein